MRSLKSIGQKSFGVLSSLAIAAGASAQDAVQWRVEDGGNGHWYQALNAVTGDSGLALAASLGGHLATISSAGENTFVKQVFLATDKQWGWLGLRQLNGQSSPFAGWYWLTEESMNYSNWTSHDGAFPTGAPDDSPCALPPWGVENDQANQGAMDRTGRWDDLETGAPSCGGPIFNTVALIEWSADCNADGIVDYGQIRAGELEDANSNNIPDCCEQGSDCQINAVQWRVEDGGNGHWYSMIYGYENSCWEDLADAASARGGYLATVTSASENEFVYQLVVFLEGEVLAAATYLGARQPDNACEPLCGWEWVTGEPWIYTNWADPGCCVYDEDALEMNAAPGSNGSWRDDRLCRPDTVRALIEWSADCNADGIVDFGQIRAGELEDANSNNIPDCCESTKGCDPCSSDIDQSGTVNAVDLAAILTVWGTDGGKYPRADINGDGEVNGPDLAAVLSNWGSCP